MPSTDAELREKRLRASLAAKQDLDDRIAALGAARLRAAAASKEIDPDTAGVWAKRGLSASAFRGPRGVWCVREAEFEAELEQWRCKGDGCTHFALLSTDGLCRRCRRRVPRAGRLTAEEFTTKHGLRLRPFTQRLETGAIPGERIDRDGFPDAWLVDDEQALRVLRKRFSCRGDGCTHFALGDTGYCGDCAPVGNALARAEARWPESPGKVRKACTECGRERTVYPSLQRSGGLCAHCSIAAEDRETAAALLASGLVPMKMTADLLYLSITGVRSAVTLERRKLGRRRRVRLGVNARDVLKLSPHPDARRKLSKPLAALNGTERIGAPLALSDAELAIVVELRSRNPGAWSWRKLADKVNAERRPDEKRVSHMTVKRAVERVATHALPL